MASNAKDEINEDTVVEIDLHSLPHQSDIILNNESVIAPVIIEEIDENVLTSMDVDINEFVEAKALEVQEITEDDMSNYTLSECCNSITDITVDTEDQDVLLTAEEEDRLTKQFLNGELTFSEYSSRMDQDVDLEAAETDFTRKDFDADEIDTKKHSQRKTHKSFQVRRKKRRTLPAVLEGLMGEANLRYARGETELAAQMCMEIIRQVPSAPEPFQTLAMIYETDQPEKSLQFALIAAHLSPRDSEQWVRLANLSLEGGNIKQAITCYSKAIQASPKDVNLYNIRAQLQEQNGDKRAYIRGYSKLIHQLEPEDSENIIKYSKILAERYMQENNNEQALEAMENIFTKCPNCITLEEVNIMTEILIALKLFKRCLSILTKHTAIRVMYKTVKKIGNSEKKEDLASTQKGESANQSDNLNIYEIEACEMPRNVVVDLKAKFIITLIELDQMAIAEKLLADFYEHENPEVSGDLYLDLAETLMGKKEFQRALVLLDPLVKSTKFSLAAVWLRHAECWVGCKDLKKAIESYEIVRDLSPQHLGARTALAKLYQLKGQYDKAIEVLHQDPETDTLDPNVLYKRTILLFKVKKYDEYFRCGLLLLSRHCITIRSKVEMNALTRANGVRQRLETLHLHRLTRGEKIEEENQPTFVSNNDLDDRKEFLLFLQMCKLAYRLKKFGLLQRFCFSALTSKKFEKRNSQIMFLCLISCIYNNDSYHGFNIVRQFARVCQRPNSWNLLNIIIQRAEDSRHNRFIMRVLGREDVFSYLHIMHANNCLVSGTYKYALNDYVSLFKVAPSALLALLVGVTLLQMASQKSSAKKNQLVLQAIAFFNKYSQLRGEDGEQEAHYNTARAFHQVGLLPTATHYYKLVLNSRPAELIQQNSYLLDLKKEAAFNLHLIYLQSENYLLARTYLEDYIIV